MSTLIVKKYPDRIVMAQNVPCKKTKADNTPDSSQLLIKRIGSVLVGVENKDAKETEYVLKMLSKDTPLQDDTLWAMCFVADLMEGKYKDEIKNSYIIAFRENCFAYENGVIHSVKDTYVLGDHVDIARGALYMSATPKQAIIATRVVTQTPGYRVITDELIIPESFRKKRD